MQAALRAIETVNQDKLFGIFGDAQWTNKDRLPDAMLRDLIEHFSQYELTVANLPEDELGNGYEYLIKKFADDSGHTAAEFYTNRTVVHLMTEMLEPQPGEAIYDPTCGSGGMLLSAIAHLRRQQKEWRNVRLYGQERNLMTSSIARMNCFLHGIEDFDIQRGDTLSEPKLIIDGSLRRFDVVLANPPYSIKQWDRTKFAADPWGRNLYGTPPQGRADYAFWQHILCSLTPKTGRCAILFPHGVLFRQEEAEMRRKLIEADLIECVLGLGPNLFYNSPMEACVVICRTAKPKARKGRILFINAVNEVTRERAQSTLTDDHLQRIVKAYRTWQDEAGFARVVRLDELRQQNGNLSIPLYVAPASVGDEAKAEARDVKLNEALADWLASPAKVRASLTELLNVSSPPAAKPVSQVSKPKREVQPAFKRAVLAAEITSQMHTQPTFGSVKQTKVLFMCEKHLQLDHGAEHKYLRQAAGPYDPKAMRSIESTFKQNHWFNVVHSPQRVSYFPSEKAGSHGKYFANYFGNRRSEINQLIVTFTPLDTARCEIVATLYAAWLDFIEQGKSPNDEEIINEVLTNWHESKRRIPHDRWMKALGWMKEKSLTPLHRKGTPPVVTRRNETPSLSLSNLKPAQDWAKLPLFDRCGRRRLPFGAFAESINERVEPANAADEVYVGLDDLDSGSLHIRRWGKGSDVIGTKLRFRQGDLIFGRRRAYQRKLAVAEMDGICSAHALVVRAKPEFVLPEFLPFLMMSDKFMNRAVEISVGSLSPTINWTTLKLQEFDLPPLDQQRRIAEILWAVDEAIQRWLIASSSAGQQYQAIISEFIKAHEADNALLNECLDEVQYGSSSKAILQPSDGLLPLLRIPNVIRGKVDFTDLVWVNPTEEFEKYRLAQGDVLIVRTNGNPDYVGRTAVYEDFAFEQCVFASYLIRLKTNREKLLPQFLHEMLQSKQVKKDIRKQVKSSAGNYNLNTQGIRSLRIPLPAITEQEDLLKRLESVSAIAGSITHQIEAQQAMNSIFLTTVFN